AAPPSSRKNWRRLGSSMGAPSRNPLCQLSVGSGCPGSAQQVLGGDLNRSESRITFRALDLRPAGTFSSIPAIDMSQQARHRTPLGGIVSTAEPLIRLPVHALLVCRGTLPRCSGSLLDAF